MQAKKTVEIKRPNFQTATFEIKGDSPLVVHRFSSKIKAQMKLKMETGKAASTGKNREAKSMTDAFNESRYVSKEGWDGFHAAAIRNAMIAACRLVSYPMTLAKMSVFIIQDGWDNAEPQIPLVRIYGKPVQQEDMARVETGQPYVTCRAAYHNWSAKLKIRWDADQFTIDQVTSLLSRAGTQVGICEGRPFSKNSAGMGWGTFTIASK